MEPGPDRELGVERDCDAPLLPAPGDVDVQKPLGLDQAYDLVLADLRLDEVGVLLIVLQQPILERRQPEEMARLRPLLDRPARVERALPLLVQIALGLERL